jgi:hypothetical protein
MDKYVLPLLEKEIKSLRATLKDKDWGNHKATLKPNTYRFYARQELRELLNAKKILNEAKLKAKQSEPD